MNFEMELERPQGIKHVRITYTVASDELSIDSVCDHSGVPVGTTLEENMLILDAAHLDAHRNGIYRQ